MKPKKRADSFWQSGLTLRLLHEIQPLRRLRRLAKHHRFR
jgi:hypothetical protein